MGQSTHHQYFARRPIAGGVPTVTKFRSDEVFSDDPRDQKLAADREASRLTMQSFLDSGVSMRAVALLLATGEKRIRQCGDPHYPTTLSLSQLLRIPPALRKPIVAYLAALDDTRIAAMPAPEDESARELALEALQTSAGAVQAVLQSEDAASTKLDADEALKRVNEAIRALEKVAANLVQAQRGNVRPIRNGDR